MGNNKLAVRIGKSDDLNAKTLITISEDLPILHVIELKKFRSEISNLPVVEFSYIINGTKKCVKAVQLSEKLLVNIFFNIVF